MKKTIRLSESDLIRLVKRVISENELGRSSKQVIKESYLPNIVEGDDLCDILCYRKQASYGSNGEIVKQIQHALARCGFNTDYKGGGMIKGCEDDHTKCDGKFRKETKKAVEDFQKTQDGLKADGVVGPETLKKLQEKGCIKLPECKCEDKKSFSYPADKQEWWKLIGKNDSKFGDCTKINACLYNVLKNNTGFSWEKFLKCMESQKKDFNDCSKCPATYNMMPVVGGKKDPNRLFIELCIANKCTKPIY